MLDIELDGTCSLNFRQNGENLRYHFGSSGRFIILMSVLPRDLGEPGWFMTGHRLHFNWSHCLVTILDIRIMSC